MNDDQQIDSLDPAYDPLLDAPVDSGQGQLIAQAKDDEYVTFPNGLRVKKEHLKYHPGNPNPSIISEFRPLYTSGLPAGYGSGLPGKGLLEDVTAGATEVLKNISVPAKGLADFAVDAVSTMFQPIVEKTGLSRTGLNLENLNKQWDELSREDTTERQQLRKFFALALPSFIGGVGVGNLVNKTALTGKAAWAARAAGGFGVEAGVMGLSDQSLEEPALQATLKKVKQAVPWAPIPDALIPKDGESTETRKARNMLESGVTSLAADVLGVMLTAAPKMKWFQPKDDVAKAYKQGIIDRSDPETLSRLVEIEQALATKPNQANAKVLMDEAKALREQLELTGKSSLTTKSRYERAITANEESRRLQLDEDAIIKLEADPEIYGRFVPEITPGLANPNQIARQTIDPEAVAKNMLDTTAIKQGLSTGDPAPMLSTPFIKRGLVLGKSRDAVAGLAEHSKMVGNFDGIVDGIRVTRQQMKDAAWDIYGDIIRAGSKQDVAKLFAENRAVLPLANDLKVSYLNPIQQEQAQTALADLTDMWLGRDVTETSARVMDTLGREIASAAEAGVKFQDLIDDNHVQEIIGDKLEYLMNEVGIGKFIAGWQLKNQDWIQRIQKSSKPGELAELINDEFTQALNARHAKIKNFRQNLEAVKESNPELAKTFYKMFSETDGDVDTIEKLFEWGAAQITPFGMVLSPEALNHKMNYFAKGAWGVIMNNVLSVRSAFNAVKGNVFSGLFQDISAVMGHGVAALVKQDGEVLKRALYYHTVDFETQIKALRHAANRMVRTHTDFDFAMQATRKDFVFQEARDWEALDEIAKEWERTGQYGKYRNYQVAKANRNIARMGWYRLGMTGMAGVDAYTDVIQATKLAKVKAMKDVIDEHGKATPELLEKALDNHYNNMFDENGLITDEAVKFASGEIALNLDDPISNYISRAVEAVPAAKPLFMFPKTNINDFKYAMSYTPLTLIPGFKNKYGKVLTAGSDPNKIRQALAEHGVNMDTNPYAMEIFDRLRNEYVGRMTFGGSVAIAAYQYAMGGNIRGNGPTNPSERKKLMDNYDWKPKTIKIGNRWHSYDGIPVLEHILSLVGDAAYYANEIGPEATEDAIDKLGWSISATYFHQTPLHGVEPLLAMLNGDDSALNRFKANMIRMAIPQSGNLAMINDAITSSQKAIYNDMMGYVMNRLPGAASTLPVRRDLWTGKPLNEGDNHLLRALNATGLVKISAAVEPWREWLYNTGYDGISNIVYTSEGSRRYTNDEQDLIGEYMGDAQLWKKVDAIKDNEYFNAQLDEMRAFRKSGASYEDIKLKETELPVYQYLDNIVNEAKRNAEIRMSHERPDIWRGIQGQEMVDKFMQQGNIKGAQEAAEWTEKSVNELRRIQQMRK